MIFLLYLSFYFLLIFTWIHIDVSCSLYSYCCLFHMYFSHFVHCNCNHILFFCSNIDILLIPLFFSDDFMELLYFLFHIAYTFQIAFMPVFFFFFAQLFLIKFVFFPRCETNKRKNNRGNCKKCDFIATEPDKIVKL